MNCASCGRTNRDGARFCGGCGGSLAPRCPACGVASEPGANRKLHGTREGGPFESVFVQLFLTRGARIEHYEIFDLADAERALARFTELSSG